jgi:SPP1 family predicted phage head-tail adaptor
MRAGKLDKTIVIERVMTTPDDYGTPLEAWVPIGTLRAQVVQHATDEYQRERGSTTETTIVFRTRFLEGVTVADRVTFDGDTFNMKQVKELGRRRGLELRCERLGQ